MSHHCKNKDATGGSVKAHKPERGTNLGRSTIGGVASGRGTAASGCATGSASGPAASLSAPPSRQAHAHHGDETPPRKQLMRFIYTAAGSVARDVDWLGLPAQLSSDQEKRLVRKVKRRVQDAIHSAASGVGGPIDSKHLGPDVKDVVKRYVSIHLHCSRAGTASGTSLAGTTTPLY
jgi:hypothetical protein